LRQAIQNKAQKNFLNLLTVLGFLHFPKFWEDNIIVGSSERAILRPRLIGSKG